MPHLQKPGARRAMSQKLADLPVRVCHTVQDIWACFNVRLGVPGGVFPCIPGRAHNPPHRCSVTRL